MCAYNQVNPVSTEKSNFPTSFKGFVCQVPGSSVEMEGFLNYNGGTGTNKFCSHLGVEGRILSGHDFPVHCNPRSRSKTELFIISIKTGS